MKPLSALVSICFGLVLFCLPASAVSCLDADLLVRNGHIVTMDPDHKIATAMAIRDGKILAVGDDKTLASCASPRTKIMDLQKHTVIPGLIDVHTHAMEWAKSMLRGEIDATYPTVHAITDITREISRRTATLQSGQWVQGAGWDDAKLAEHRYITRQDLDVVAPNHPVYLDHVSGHLAAVNSAALKLAGIGKETPDPQGGVVERDAAGEPTGILKDTAMTLVMKLLPKDPGDINVRAAQLVSQKAAELGLTTIHDIFLSADEIRGYQDAHFRGWLKIRVQMSPQIASPADAEKLAQMGVHTGFGDDVLKFGAAKMFADGGMGARTIAIYPPA